MLYDLAKTFSEEGKTVVIHCGKMPVNIQMDIYYNYKAISQLNIITAEELKNGSVSFDDYNYILVDESHRVYTNQFETICNSVRKNDQVYIFSADPEQILSKFEKQHNIVCKIKGMSLSGNYTLPNKIRTNKQLYSFVMCMMDLNYKAKVPVDYSNVKLNYANTKQEVHFMLEYYAKKGYVFINYSKSNSVNSPYSEYKEEEKYDTHHIIGQEFDKIVMLMDLSFYYDKNGTLQAIEHPNPNYLYTNLLYQGGNESQRKTCNNSY